MAATTRPRGKKLAEIIDHTHELQFVQHRVSGVVHIVVPAAPWWMEERDAPKLSELPEDQVAEAMVDLVLGKTLMLCGWIAKVDRRDETDTGRGITCFDDELLCAGCHQALGDEEHRARAFEHPRPGDDEEEA